MAVNQETINLLADLLYCEQDGQSAYQIWLDRGNVGTPQDFLDSLTGAIGPQGKSAYEIWLDDGHEGTETDFLNWLKGADGSIGLTGTDGAATNIIYIDHDHLISPITAPAPSINVPDGWLDDPITNITNAHWQSVGKRPDGVSPYTWGTPQRVRGIKWFSDSGAPSNIVGAELEDYYLDVITEDVYQLFSGPTWNITTNIQGTNANQVEFLFQDSPTKPTIASSSTVAEAIATGWLDNYPLSIGSVIWTVKGTDSNGDGIYNWGNVTQFTGDKGDIGLSGNAIDFTYIIKATRPSAPTDTANPPITGNPDGDIWTATPASLPNDNSILWKSMGVLPIGSTDWYWEDPVQASVVNGTIIDYIYIIASSTPTEPADGPYPTNTDPALGWADTPGEPGTTTEFLYMSTATLQPDGVTWAFSEPIRLTGLATNSKSVNFNFTVNRGFLKKGDTVEDTNVNFTYLPVGFTPSSTVEWKIDDTVIVSDTLLNNDKTTYKGFISKDTYLNDTINLYPSAMEGNTVRMLSVHVEEDGNTYFDQEEIYLVDEGSIICVANDTNVPLQIDTQGNPVYVGLEVRGYVGGRQDQGNFTYSAIGTNITATENVNTGDIVISNLVGTSATVTATATYTPTGESDDVTINVFTVANGIDGASPVKGVDYDDSPRINSGYVYYKTTLTNDPTTAPNASGTVTYNFSTDSFSNLNINWQQEPVNAEIPANTNESYWATYYTVTEDIDGNGDRTGTGTVSFSGSYFKSTVFDGLVTFTNLNDELADPNSTNITTIDGGKIIASSHVLVEGQGTLATATNWNLMGETSIPVKGALVGQCSTETVDNVVTGINAGVVGATEVSTSNWAVGVAGIGKGATTATKNIGIWGSSQNDAGTGVHGRTTTGYGVQGYCDRTTQGVGYAGFFNHNNGSGDQTRVTLASAESGNAIDTLGDITISSGNVLTIGSTDLTEALIGQIGGGSGTITSVGAGTGLTDSGTATDPVLNISFAGTGSATTASKSDHTHTGYVSTNSGDQSISSSSTNYGLKVYQTSNAPGLMVDTNSTSLNSSLWLQRSSNVSTTWGMVNNTSNQLAFYWTNETTPEAYVTSDGYINARSGFRVNGDALNYSHVGACSNIDSRLSDARTPLEHSHPYADSTHAHSIDDLTKGTAGYFLKTNGSTNFWSSVTVVPEDIGNGEMNITGWPPTASDYAWTVGVITARCGASGQVAGVYKNSANTQVAWLAGDSYALYVAIGASGPFTGAHDAIIDATIVLNIGDIVVDQKVLIKKDVSNALTQVSLSNQVNQKNVIGVLTNNALLDIPENLAVNSNLLDEEAVCPKLEALRLQGLKYTVINSIGEGQINVCGENGDLEAGDFITTSSMVGKGMKQDDDLVHNYTVAKVREDVTFSSPDEVKMVACIYLCG